MSYIVICDAADGTKSAAGPFHTLLRADAWAAQLEILTNGEFSGQAVALENPREFLAEAFEIGEVR